MKQETRLRFKNTKFAILLAILLALAIGLGGGYLLWHTCDVVGFEQALVVRVIDGDTIELESGQRVRYLGIDTPETGEPYAAEATERNRELVEGMVVELQTGSRDKDEYDRLLRYVYVDGTFVNAELVAEGLASAYIFDPDDRYSQVLVQLEQYAKMKEEGMWAGNQTLPSN